MFDGDEMNLHAPQSVEAATELREIAAVPLQIVSPRESVPIVSVVQDTLVGANRFTRPNVLFNKKETMNLLVHAKRWDGKLPEPITMDPQPMWSGQQLLSALLPPVSLQMPNNSYSDADKTNPNSQNMVKILNGQIMQGILDKTVFSKQLLHIIYNDYGPDMTVDFLDSLQAMIAAFLMNSGFSVGISDLIADDATNLEINDALEKLTKTVENQILQLHTGLFENSSGRSNQEEFEGKTMSVLNRAVGVAGNIGLKTLSDTNRMTNMVKAGSKGSDVNVSQMIGSLGQTAIEGKRVPNGFQHRTLPHFKRFDDSARARGFIASSYIKGLQPDEFFFHAMSGREGLIDTAVKSVTGDTQLVVMENSATKTVAIGDWIDRQLANAQEKVEHFEERNMELLQLDEPVYIPTTDADGNVSWGLVTAITRHDPGKELYEIKTSAGKRVIVTESQSLLIYDDEKKQFLRKPSPDVRPGHFVPVTMSLAAPPIVAESVPLQKYLPKTEYLYGTDFHIASKAVEESMIDRERIPAGWWSEHNGSTFVLPYDSKAKLQRTLVRSNITNIQTGYVYPFTTNREHSRIPDTFEFTYDNGLFTGLFLAEGNVDIDSGYVQITNNDSDIRAFVSGWFDKHGINHKESVRTNALGGTSSDVRGYSTILAQFLTAWLGHGAANKYVPEEVFGAPEEFIRGLLDGYISGDGTISANSVEVSSASARLIDGISMVCTRLGIFGKVSITNTTHNNIGTEHILPTHRFAIRAQWASRFAEQIKLIDSAKEERLRAMAPSVSHRNFAFQKDVVLDEIVEIRILGIENYPKVYDLTVPSTLNFGLANGLHVVDTADTGYMQRQIRVALEDLITQHDGSVRDAMGNILQIAYGEDGINATKLESQPLPITGMSDDDIRAQYAAEGAPGAEQYITDAIEDRRILVEKIYQNKPQKNVRYPVHLERIIHSIKYQFNMVEDQGTVTASEVLEAQAKILSKTHAKNRLWGALVRYHMRPLVLKKIGYNPVSLDALSEQVVLKHWKSWVEPGQPVGVIAAQSIGEPATQMTLNSVDYDTEIIIAKNGVIMTPVIGEFIDAAIAAADPTKIQYLPNDQIYVPLEDGNEWSALSCDEDGKMMWTRLEAVTKHPVINEDGTDTILEVEMESGRIVKATKAKSFLTYRDQKIVDINGSDLTVGDVLPVANNLALGDMPMKTLLEVKEYLPPSAWLYGDEIKKALEALHTADANGERNWFTAANGDRFTVPYNRSDSFRDAFVNGHNSRAEEFVPGFVYPKSTRTCSSHIPSSIPLDRAFGFFAGAYLSEGSTSDTQIQITNNDMAFLAPIQTLLDGWKVGYHIVEADKLIENTQIKGHTTSLVIHSTLLTSLMKSIFGSISYEKKMPAWVLQASDEFVCGLVDGYFSGDGTVSESGTSIACSSVSQPLITMMSALLSRYGIFTVTSDYMPPIGNFKSVSRQYRMSISLQYSKLFAETFTLTILAKQDRLNATKANKNSPRARRQHVEGVILDTIKSIRETHPKGGKVYDITVEKTRNFTVLNQLCVKDTFHLAGVAAKSNMTRGVPRLKELLKATRNPKAIELTIPLRRDLREKKEEARRVSQELEFTLLQDIVTVARIYYDPRDSATTIAADVDWLAYLSAFENASARVKAVRQAGDPMTGEDDHGPIEEAPKSPWILRFELDRERMFGKNITMDDIAYILKTKFGGDLVTLYTDYNANRLIFRARLAVFQNPIDDLNTLKTLQNKVLSSTAVRGIPGLRSVNYQKIADTVELKDGKYQPVEQYVMISDGSNFREVITHPDVDPNRVISSNVHDMFENLGIEATRATLFKEITTLFAESGSSVNYRHVCVLIDKMCHKGRTMSIDRYGINKNDIGPLAKMSFEQTEDIALRAATFGERDPVLGVSAKVMLGAPIRAGTSFSELLFDEMAAIKLSESTPEQHQLTSSGPTYTDEDVDGMLYGEEDSGECSIAELRMAVNIPPARMEAIVEEEADVDIAIIE